MSEPTCLVADTICRTVELGVAITGAAIAKELTWIDCRPVEHDPTCPKCGQPGGLRDHVERVLTDLPVVGHPTRLRVRVPRFTCGNDGCAVTIFRQRTDRVAAPKASTTRRCARWIVQRLAIDKMSVAAIAKALGLSWNTVNIVAAELARELVFGSPAHLAGVRYLGVDEHKWKHRRGQGDPDFVTVLVDLTPVIDGTGPARLLDMVAGRSAEVLGLAQRPRGELPQPSHGGGDGRVRRLPHRHRRCPARSTGRHGSISRNPLSSRQTHCMPPAHPAGHLRSSRPHR
ncbi:hypothetical protein MFAL_30370 [Mycolicibacterium fallax]|nr:hypothetical protein MFAL_30370 [Mycolicibacterium fallax]